MDLLFFLGESLALAGLAYGAWLCFLLAGKYDEESLRADVTASRAAGEQEHSELITDYRRPAGRISKSPVA